MSGCRLTIVRGETPFADVVREHLAAAFTQQVGSCSFAAWEADNGSSDGDVCLLAVDSRADRDAAYQVVQLARLQDWPGVLVVVEGSEECRDGGLSHLDPHVAARLRWPQDAAPLVAFLRQQFDSNPHPVDPEPTVSDDVSCRRLLRLTPSLLRFTEYLITAATHEIVLLLTGETGTGKTYLARVLHECSPRREHPFVVVPCGTLPAHLVESAFFGHVKGAFTGADRAVVGKFEAAGEGTILLDEIDTLGLKDQAALLRVLETGEFERLGSNKTLRCRARILVASNWNLDDAVATGRFRQDLYYRLNALAFHLPPLRERREDIVPLSRAIVAALVRRFRKPLFHIDTEALAVLANHPWPGNIRQLQNVLQQAVLCCSGGVLLARHLPETMRQPPSRPAESADATRLPASLIGSRQIVERSMILEALESAGYSRVRAARKLGISRVTLYKKLKKYGLESVPRPEPETSE